MTMRTAYRVLAYLLALSVAVQASLIAFGAFALENNIDKGRSPMATPPESPCTIFRGRATGRLPGAEDSAPTGAIDPGRRPCLKVRAGPGTPNWGWWSPARGPAARQVAGTQNIPI